jgi:hypothetical protein
MSVEQIDDIRSLQFQTLKFGGNGPIDRFLDSLGNAAVSFIIRFAEPSILDYSVQVREALNNLFPEPHDLTTISLTDTIIAAIITPRSKQSLDPVYIHAIASAAKFRIRGIGRSRHNTASVRKFSRRAPRQSGGPQ